MLKKFMTGVFTVFAAAFVIMLAGCSEYTMTEEDLALQRAIKGYWSPDDSMGVNSYDEEGNPVELLIVEFTEDLNYFVHTCYVEEGYIMTNPPISYYFKNGRFTVDVDGAASYAQVNISEDGQIMKWVTDAKTETYNRIDEETVKLLGIPGYDREKWASESGETDNSEGSAE